MKYKIDLEYFIPEFSDVELEASNADEAEEKALDEIAKLYPEAQDVEVTGITELTV